MEAHENRYLTYRKYPTLPNESHICLVEYLTKKNKKTKTLKQEQLESIFKHQISTKYKAI